MSARQSPLLDGLAAVVAEAEMHGACGRSKASSTRLMAAAASGRVAGIAGDVGLIHLEAIAGQAGHLLRQHVRDGHDQGFEIAVMAVEQRAGQHVGAGDGEFEGPPATPAASSQSASRLSDAFAEGAFDHARRLAAEPHGGAARRRPRDRCGRLGARTPAMGRMKYSIMPLVSG